jgi:hypothetical protein
MNQRKSRFVVELLHQLALGADRIERLQEQHSEQLLGRDRGPAIERVELLELAGERS